MISHQPPIHSLQKLDKLLRSGAITRQEFEQLKARLRKATEGEELQPGSFVEPHAAPDIATTPDREEKDGESGSKGVILPHLEVDHLLGVAPPEKEYQNREARNTDQPQSTPTSPIAAPPVKRFEPKPGNVLRFNPLRGREPETRWYEGNTLNYVLLASIIVLVLFGAYLLLNRNEYQSEQITSIRTDRFGGVATIDQQDGRLASAGPTNGYDGDLSPVTEEDFQIEQISPEEGLVEEEPEPAPAEPAQEEAPPAVVSEREEEGEASNQETLASLETEAEPAPEEETPAADPDSVPTEQPITDSASLPQASPAAGQPIEAQVIRPAVRTPAEERAVRDAEDLVRIKNSLESFYADFQAKPFSAHTHFAPRVERFYTLTNVTPQEIKENVERYHFAEFMEARSSFDPATLQIVNRENGTIEVVFVEQGEAFRKSLNQHQKITARVRAKFDRDTRMTYYRQERILTSETK